MEATEMLKIITAAQWIHDRAILPEKVYRLKYPLEEDRRRDRFAEHSSVVLDFVISQIAIAGDRMVDEGTVRKLKREIETLERLNVRLNEKLTDQSAAMLDMVKDKKKKASLPVVDDSDTPPMPKVKPPKGTKTARPGEAVIADDQFKDARSHRKGGSSKFIGVTLKAKENRKKPWTAQVNREEGFKYLGAHETELLAAAAVQEHLGNKQLAADLRHENEFAGRIEEKHGPRTTKIQCTGCAEEYDKEPNKCVKCNGTAFETIKILVVDDNRG